MTQTGSNVAFGGDREDSPLSRLARWEATQRFPSVRQGNDRRVFDELSDPGVNLALWQRELPIELEAWLKRWATRRSGSLEQVISPSHFKLAPFLRGLEGRLRDWLSKDLSCLIARFGRLGSAKRIRLAFGPIHNDRCRKFHTDNLRYRLICTYAGPGTEWLPNEAVNRAAMDCTPGCPDKANAKIMRSESSIERASAGDVLIMKKDLHPHGLGLVHRSPPIEHLQGSRVALILSTVDWE